MSDQVNHPSHYNKGDIEVIEYIEDQRLGYHLGNAVKYISRAGAKDPAKLKEDLDKAIWYIKRHVEIEKARAEKRKPVRPNEMPKVRNWFTECDQCKKKHSFFATDEAVKLNLESIFKDTLPSWAEGVKILGGKNFFKTFCKKCGKAVFTREDFKPYETCNPCSIKKNS